MKPILEHLPRKADESFVVRHFDYAYFPTPWHYHPEYEIVLVTESRGKRFIGDRITDFDEGDLALIGSYLPHLYRNDEEYYDPGSALRARSIVVHFLEDSLGKDTLCLPEMQSVRKLLNRSRQGLEFTGRAGRAISRRLYELLELEGFERWLMLMEILYVMAEDASSACIASATIEGHHEKDQERLHQVFEYVMQHFREDVTLEQAAGLANMAPAAFSRYFKYRTRKTFSAFLLELRISHAGKLLMQTDKPVSEICFSSGFNNLSNFNRHFKTFYDMQPLRFRKTYQS